MKVLSIRQPYAAMLLTGEKQVEFRSWATKYRGLLLIHAAQRPVDLPVARDDTRRIAAIRGAVVGQANLIDILLAPPHGYAWILADPVVFERPIPLRGRLGLFDYVGILPTLPDGVALGRS